VQVNLKDGLLLAKGKMGQLPGTASLNGNKDILEKLCSRGRKMAARYVKDNCLPAKNLDERIASPVQKEEQCVEVR
jgi:hypothetical protein